MTVISKNIWDQNRTAGCCTEAVNYLKRVMLIRNIKTDVYKHIHTHTHTTISHTHARALAHKHIHAHTGRTGMSQEKSSWLIVTCQATSSFSIYETFIGSKRRRCIIKKNLELSLAHRPVHAIAPRVLALPSIAELYRQ